MTAVLPAEDELLAKVKGALPKLSTVYYFIKRSEHVSFPSPPPP